MHKLLNHLIQLQDFNFTLAEQQALLSDVCLMELEEAIKALSKNYPTGTAPFRYPACTVCSAVVPVTGGICAGSGVAPATSKAYELHSTREIVRCPAAHGLYLPARAPRAS